jgi:hypothetical protein
MQFAIEPWANRLLSTVSLASIGLSSTGLLEKPPFGK